MKVEPTITMDDLELPYAEEHIRKADLVFACDKRTNRDTLLYGDSLLEEIIRSNQSRNLSVCGIACDWPDDQDKILGVVYPLKNAFPVRESRATVRLYDFTTKQITEIPAAELAPGWVCARREGIEGIVYVQAEMIQCSPPRHQTLTAECQKVLRYYTDTFSGIDPRSIQEHDLSLRRDVNPGREVLALFHIAYVFRLLLRKRKRDSRTKHALWLFLNQCSLTEPSTILYVSTLPKWLKHEAREISEFFYKTDYKKEFERLFNSALLQ